MESEKIPFLLEDLVPLLSNTMEWAPASVPARLLRMPPLNDEAREMLSLFSNANRGLDMREIEKERKALHGNVLCLLSKLINPVSFITYIYNIARLLSGLAVQKMHCAIRRPCLRTFEENVTAFALVAFNCRNIRDLCKNPRPMQIEYETDVLFAH